MVMEAFVPALFKSLGIFIPLIVVHCIILQRAEAFANQNTVWHSALDGIGMGLGFTIALTILGTIREILGAGTWFGMQVMPESFSPAVIMILPPGAFFTLGLLMFLLNLLTQRKRDKREA
jgi:electron transport complex protein RnfE